MAITAAIYKSGILLGTGTATAGSAAISGYAANLSRTCVRKNVQIMCTGGSSSGVFKTRVLTDDLAGNLTLDRVCPFAA